MISFFTGIKGGKRFFSRQTRFALKVSLAGMSALLCAAAFLSCNTDSPSLDYDDMGGGADRTSRMYQVILPDPTDKGGLSASPMSAKLGNTVIVSYTPPNTGAAENETDVENTQPAVNYTITSLTGSYNNGQKRVSIARSSEGGGGDLSSPCRTRTYI
ncbi:MAG: hypothetical protein LBC27_08685 [Spirochaetaceae bacterium]|nr:hypothetical protein [Spirochaetaceae bacterium]